MKKALLYLLLLCNGFNLSAQNYQCLRHDSTIYWFTDNIHYLRGIRIDSVIVSGADTIYYPYQTGRYTPSYTPAGASWVGQGVIQQPDGTFLFGNAYSDTVVIKTQANLGDNWIFCHDTSSLFYKATVTAIDTMTILGALDSVKQVTINAYNPALVTTDYVNNFTFLLSKYHGFAQIFDLYNFPYHDPASAIEDCTDHYFNILSAYGAHSQIFNMVPFHVPTRKELYDLHPTDVLEYNTTTYCSCALPDYEGPEYDSVLYRNDIDPFHAKIALYRILGVNTFMCNEPDSDRHYNTYIETDTVIMDTTTAFVMNGLPEETIWSPTYYYNPVDTTHCFTGAFITVTLSGIFDCGNYRTDYKVGLSFLDSGFCQVCPIVGGAGAETYVNLIYSRKDGTPCGNPPNLTVDNPTQNAPGFTLSPNPTNDVFVINKTDDQQPYTYTIINTFGQIVKTISSNSSKVIFDVHDLAPGLYYVSIVSDKGEKINKKILVIH